MADTKRTLDKVLFQYGTQANLNKIRKQETGAASIAPGTIYVTTDSRRMWLGVQEGTGTSATKDIIPLNDSIIKVASVSALPTAYKDIEIGSFYYAALENVLCIYMNDGDYDQGGWRQINPDTNYYVNASSIAGETSSNDNTAIVTQTLHRTDEQGNTNPKGDNDGGTVDTVFKFTGDDDIIVTWDSTNKTVKFTCNINYTLYTTPNASENSVTVGLYDEEGANNNLNHGSFTIKGASGINVSSDNVGNITITGSGTDYQLDTGSATWNAGQIDYKITQDNGHFIDFSLVAPTINVGQTPETITHIGDGVYTLPVYTQTDIDNKLRALNGMTYRSTCAAAPANDNQHIGDTYKTTESFEVITGYAIDEVTGIKTTITTTVNVGDLIIANGNELSDGNDIGEIDPNTIYWEIVASGDDVDTTYKGSYLKISDDEYQLKLMNQASGTHDAAISLKVIETTVATTTYKDSNGDSTGSSDINAGKDLILTGTSSNNGQDMALTLKHATQNVTITTLADGAIQSEETPKTISVIKEITYDAAGHITGYSIQNETFIDTNGSLTSNVDTVKPVTNSNAVTISNTTEFEHTGSQTDSIITQHSIRSDNNNLIITADNSVTDNPTVVINLVWGCFDPQT